ncbi:LysR family transcriptional regulator for metE and metH [Chitinivorax tropicus]|uniref:HTH-type transcriptional regulator MetR n=1 Tax=Chitinivorax tropicus TaxID=714531 RepID=A0A840MSQ7_9PROT|nr:LysR family transcriptional regulator [Chitinivorax tropicus]MBB5020119.1 LysR family transcriptional regulator for metE and metH [Chitinivorax tropicus]
MTQSIIEIRHLRTLQAIAETGSVSRAGARLHLTQSAVSHQIKALELHYGLELFDRKTQPIKLTLAGERLLQLATLVLPQVAAADRDLARLLEGQAGQLRIAVECHTCFDWLMPAMDRFRAAWPEVELDIVSGFHADPVGLLLEDRADLAIVSDRDETETAVLYHPLFMYEIVGLVANDHPLAAKPNLAAADFAAETLITYPVPDDMLDLIRQVLKPAGVAPARRTSELTVAILQLVASRRGVAALPAWAVQGYVERGYLAAKAITSKGLWGRLYGAIRQQDAGRAYLADFLATMRNVCFQTLPGIESLD